jgi:hypothetical protein
MWKNKLKKKKKTSLKRRKTKPENQKKIAVFYAKKSEKNILDLSPNLNSCG